MPTVTLPPLKYDHAYSGTVIERVLPLEEARQVCANIVIAADGCSAFVTGENGAQVCYIVLPLNGPDENIDHYRRHELAHCNVWPPSHPAE